MNVADTGGTGFVGAHTTRALLDAGHHVRVLVRRPQLVVDVLGPMGVAPSDIESVEGDVADPDSVEALLGGVDAVIHTAAMIGLNRRDLERMRRTNVEGTAVSSTSMSTAGSSSSSTLASTSSAARTVLSASSRSFGPGTSPRPAWTSLCADFSD